MESDEGIKIEGEGYLINRDSDKRFPVKFEVEQIRTGKISGKCTLSGFEYEDILNPSQLKNCRCISGELIKISVYEMQEYILENFRKSHLKGETNNRDEVIINDIFTYGCQTNFSESRSERSLNLKFSAGKVEVSCETISIKDQFWIKYGIINLDLRRLLRGCIETDIGKITFSTWKDHKEVIEEMKTFKTPLLSGFLNITDVNIGNFESFDSYLKTVVDDTIEKVLELLSLAQSTYLSHCSVRIYAKTSNSNSQDDYKLKKLIMRDIKTKAPSLGQPLIKDLVDIYKFISPKTFQKYTDLREKFDLNIAFEWYLNSLSSDLQSRYLQAFTVLELLKDRYNKEIGNEYILPESSFEEYLPDLKEKINEVLKEKEVNNKKRKKISGNLMGINRTSFPNSLGRLLKDHHIVYGNLFSDFKIMKDTRDQIIHRGIQEIDSKELLDAYQRLICLIQRIFLALLEYDGYFLDRNDKYKRKKFTDFRIGDFARTPE